MRRCQEKKSVAKWNKARGRLDVFAALYFAIPERARRCLQEQYMLAGRKQVLGFRMLQ
jgi:hypothetical protein